MLGTILIHHYIPFLKCVGFPLLPPSRFKRNCPHTFCSMYWIVSISPLTIAPLKQSIDKFFSLMYSYIAEGWI